MKPSRTARFAAAWRAAALSATAVALAASLALADPGIRVSYPAGVTRVELDGSWARSEYTVTRASTAEGPPAPITALNTLCLGACFVEDPTAEAGRTYWYRFDLVLPDGSLARFGPYAVTVSPALSAGMGVGVFPNPARGAQSIDLFLAGRPGDPAVVVRVDVFDASGRRVRLLRSGPLAPGSTRLTWDGADDRGRRVAPGAYVMQFATPRGVRTARLLRIE